MSAIKTLFRIFYAPLFFGGFIAAGVALVAAGERKLWLIGLLVGAIVVSFAAERIAPFEPVWNRPDGDVGRDVLHALINEGSALAAVLALPLLHSLLPDFGIWPAGWPLLAQLGLAILIADCGITLAHYLSHKWHPLWRLHAVHHSVTRMYGFNGLLKHPLHQAVELTAGTLPLVLMGLPFECAALLGFAVAVQLLLQHSNVDMRVGPLGFLWAVAPGHRHHHLSSAARGDVNFGLFTLIWDHLLGTFVINRPAPRAGEIGLDGHPDYPNSYGAQLIEPFRPTY